MAKESFILYTSFYKPISKLSDKQLGRLFRAVFRYNLGEVFDVEEDIEMAFEFFKNQFDIDESKYQSKVMRDIENGRKGGNPNFKKGQSNPYYRQGSNGNSPEGGKEITQDNPRLSEITQDNPALPKITQDKAINDNDNDNDNVHKENSFGEKENPPTLTNGIPAKTNRGKKKCESSIETDNESKKEIPGGEANGLRSIEENIKTCKESGIWLETVAMHNHLSVEEVKQKLDDFKDHLLMNGYEDKKTLKDFKLHFNNLLRKQEENANNSTEANGTRKGEGKASGKTMGSEPFRYRPCSVC